MYPAKPLRPSQRRGFTLLEIVVASTIAFVLVAAATEMSSAMGRSVRKVEAQADLGVRTAIAHGFLQRELASLAYQWNVTQSLASGTTGSFGAGNCASASNICSFSNGNYYPIRVCRSSTVSSTTCDPPSTVEADALVSYAPRDPLVESLVIRARSDGSELPTDCLLATSPATLRVSGVNSVAWSDGDLVLVTKSNHSSIGVFRTNLPVNSDSTQQRAVSIDFGTTNSTSGLALDDGGRTSCSTRDSLLGASVLRIRQLILRVDEGGSSANRDKLVLGTRNTAAGPLVWSSLVPDVDDIQFQFEFAKVDVQTKAGSFCSSNTSDFWPGSAIQSCDGPLTESADSATGRNLVRLLGLRVGLLLRSRVQTEFFARPIPLIFDRTGPSGSDSYTRRQVNMFVGIPNAIQ